jgi:hypothetical protein
MTDYMEPVWTILQDVHTDAAPAQPVSILWYVAGTGVASMAALKVLKPGCVMSETDDGLSVFSVSKALLFSMAAMLLAYVLLTKIKSS